MSLSPITLTVLQGEEARFTCSPSNSDWTVMVWSLHDRAVLTISKDQGPLPSITPNVMAEKNTKGGWDFVLNDTKRDYQGEVTCDLQGIDRKTATLLVQGLSFICVLFCVRETHSLMHVHVSVTLVHYNRKAAKNSLFLLQRLSKTFCAASSSQGYSISFSAHTHVYTHTAKITKQMANLLKTIAV